MEVKEEKRINPNGSYTVKTVKTKTSQDGFVPETQMYENKMGHYGKYHKGYMKVTSYRTNDPKVTRPFVYGMCILFIVIGAFILLGGVVMGMLVSLPIMLVSIFLSFSFIGMGVFALVKAKKDIDRVEAEIRMQQMMQQQMRPQPQVRPQSQTKPPSGN